ncbi:MAG: helix-turn-helix transcriptional regulator [Gammaproteobacteria bacterium]|nr:helix-turn-helix transcriptional regulator [Gammaproteobacteria bacterium]
MMDENRVYTFSHTQQRTPCMAKDVNEELSQFGQQLVRLRKAAGYTQQQLADEIGTTRRKIAYYEKESDHPPAHLLTDLAQALNVTTDELLGLEPAKKTIRQPDSRLLRRMQQIEKMNPKDKRQIIQVIDTFIKAAQN